MRRTILLDQTLIGRTGFAVFDYPRFGSEILVTSGFWDPNEDDLEKRLDAYKALIDHTVKAYKPVEMVVEDHRHSSRQNKDVDEQLAVIGFICRIVAIRNGLDFHRINPMIIKARGAGDGSADKDAILKIAQERHPEIEVIDHNHADALIMGRAWRSYRSEAVRKSEKRPRTRKR